MSRESSVVGERALARPAFSACGFGEANLRRHEDLERSGNEETTYDERLTVRVSRRTSSLAECDSLNEGEFPVGPLVDEVADAVFELAGDGEIDLVVFAVRITDGPGLDLCPEIRGQIAQPGVPE